MSLRCRRIPVRLLLDLCTPRGFNYAPIGTVEQVRWVLLWKLAQMQ